MTMICEGDVYIGKHKIGALFLGGYKDGDTRKDWVIRKTFLDFDDLKRQELLKKSDKQTEVLK